MMVIYVDNEENTNNFNMLKGSVCLLPLSDTVSMNDSFFNDDQYTFYYNALVEEKYLDMFKFSNTPIIGSPRKSKLSQISHLYNYTNTPETFWVPPKFVDSRLSYYMSRLTDYGPFILKAEDGAKGIGQFRFTNKTDMSRCFNELSGDFEGNLDKWYENIGGSLTKEKLLSYKDWFNEEIFTKKNFFIQKEIVDITNEWCYIWFYGQEPIIIHRKVNDSWQANSAITNSGHTWTIKDENDKVLSDQMQNVSNLIGNDLNEFCLAFDFYYSESQGLGCFEYCPQFGYFGIDMPELTKKYSAAFLLKINDLEEEQYNKEEYGN